HKEKVKLLDNYHHIISLENLLEAWTEFIRGKRKRKDVEEFEFHLADNIFAIHRELSLKTYCHSNYEAFNISDPKPRNIHKARVRDRVVHRAIYRVLYPFFDRLFIADSYSCRNDKGVHKALDRFRSFAHKASHNHTRTAWALKCDVRKFFASIDQNILLRILEKHISDQDILGLLSEIIGSFHTEKGKGLPLGNLTSQLLVNVYMNEFDQFMKHQTKAKYYIRYADDFVIFSDNKEQLKTILVQISAFLEFRLGLKLHPDKVFIKTVASGVDFLGWTHFPDHRVLRTVTKNRAFRNIREKEGKRETVRSYLGLMKHGNAYTLRKNIETNYLPDGRDR
ncbi:MAG: reverse transcriptase domain-containing protein, partial [Candidatus Moraniibacteriota bacterium]